MFLDITELLNLKRTLDDIHSSIKNNLSGISSEISDVNSNLMSSSLSRANANMLERISSLSDSVDTNLGRLIDFLEKQVKTYQVTNEQAEKELSNLVTLIAETFGEGGVILGTAVGGPLGAASAVAADTIIPEIASSLDLSMYTSNPEKGFVVTEGNPTFDLSNEDKDFMYAMVAAESDNSYDDALAVSSVVLNRCSSPAWIHSFGTTPKGQLTGSGQFAVYKNGAYTKYTGGNAPATVKKAVDDALNGVRNCSYLSFRSNSSTKYGNNMITASGNRYK